MRIPKLVATLCACVFSMISVLSVSVSATDSKSSSVLTAGDGLWESAEELGIECLDIDSSTYLLLSNSVDNSTSAYFPSIGNQGNLNSCAGWATTYYQYTYEVNKLKGVATTNSNVYSPAWTYNYINGGGNNPSYLSDAYNVL